MVSGPPTQIDESRTSCNAERHQEHTRRRQTSTSEQIRIPTSDPQPLGSLAKLEHSTMFQIKALRAFKGQALTSEPTRALLDEIDAHRVGMQRTLAAVIILWCQDGSIAEGLREKLKANLGKGLEEINDLKHALTTTITARGIPVIHAERPSEDLQP
jgi:hypothetical protein